MTTYPRRQSWPVPDVDLDITTPALSPGDGCVEVWLIDRAGAMVSIGTLAADGGQQRLSIDPALLDRGCPTIDLSLEAFDHQPQHSETSVARGTLST